MVLDFFGGAYEVNYMKLCLRKLLKIVCYNVCYRGSKRFKRLSKFQENSVETCLFSCCIVERILVICS